MKHENDYINKTICGDCLDILKELPDGIVQICVTSPPYYGLRDYGVDGQIGLERTPGEYVQKLVDVFREVKRVLRDDGTLWLNLGDSYAGSGGAHKENHANPGISKSFKRNGVPHFGEMGQPGNYLAPKGLKPKDLIGIPWRVAFALQADGWYLRQDIIWSKPNPMPESVRDRCTKSHEYIFLLSKSAWYYYDQEAISEPVASSTISRLSQTRIDQQLGSNRVPGKTNGPMRACGNGVTRNRRSVWTVATRPFKGAHFAVFPPKLIEPCILAGCPEGGIVLDPFGGAGTTAMVAAEHGRQHITCELNPEYIKIAEKRRS